MKIPQTRSRHTAAAARLRLPVLFILNILDMAFTLVLLETGLFIEANPMVAWMLKNDARLFAFKALLPALLLVYLGLRMRKASERQAALAVRMLDILLVFYLLINALHLVWMLLIP